MPAIDRRRHRRQASAVRSIATQTKIATAQCSGDGGHEIQRVRGLRARQRERDVPDCVVERVGLTRREIRVRRLRLKRGCIAEIQARQEGGVIQEERDCPDDGANREAGTGGRERRECWFGLGRVRTRDGRHAGIVRAVPDECQARATEGAHCGRGRPRRRRHGHVGRPKRRVVLQLPAIRSPAAAHCTSGKSRRARTRRVIMLAGQIAGDPLPHGPVLRSQCRPLRLRRNIAPRAAVSKGVRSRPTAPCARPVPRLAVKDTIAQKTRGIENSRAVNAWDSCGPSAQRATSAVGRPTTPITKMSPARRFTAKIVRRGGETTITSRHPDGRISCHFHRHRRRRDDGRKEAGAVMRLDAG